MVHIPVNNCSIRDEVARILGCDDETLVGALLGSSRRNILSASILVGISLGIIDGKSDGTSLGTKDGISDGIALADGEAIIVELVAPVVGDLVGPIVGLAVLPVFGSGLVVEAAGGLGPLTGSIAMVDTMGF